MDNSSVAQSGSSPALPVKSEGQSPSVGRAIMLTQHYVEFYSPGTFLSEVSTKPVAAWDVDDAVRMAGVVTERYNATPYGFRFTTRGRGDGDLDSRQIAQSPFYYLGGTVETLAEVKARATDKDRILIANMECNGWDRVITNDNSWRVTRPLEDGDVILDFTPPAKSDAGSPSEVSASAPATDEPQ